VSHLSHDSRPTVNKIRVLVELRRSKGSSPMPIYARVWFVCAQIIELREWRTLNAL